MRYHSSKYDLKLIFLICHIKSKKEISELFLMVTTSNSMGIGMFLSCFLYFSLTRIFIESMITIEIIDIINAAKFIDFMSPATLASTFSNNLD